MLKYALRYVPLLILALIIIPLRIYMAGNTQPAKQLVLSPVFPFYQVSSPFGHYSALYSITTLPSGDAWAVGGSFSVKSVGQGIQGGIPEPASSIILHYSNNGWSAAAVAAPLKVPLFSISLDSPHDGWAAGLDGMLIHFDGNTWTPITGPVNFKQNLLGITMLSPTDGWAVGYSGSILHYDGKQWMQIQSPTAVDLHAIAMPSAQEGWAVGDSGTILHYYKGIWSVTSHAPISATLDSISMLSTAEGWIAGRQGTILHYRNGSWDIVHPVAYYQNARAYQSIDFLTVAMSSTRSGWIAAGGHFLTYSAEAWQEPVDNNNPFHDFYGGSMRNSLTLYATATSSDGAAWAAGSIASPKNGDTGVILRYENGLWVISLVIGGGEL